MPKSPESNDSSNRDPYSKEQRVGGFVIALLMTLNVPFIAYNAAHHESPDHVPSISQIARWASGNDDQPR
jgi:hypothetical protein